MQSIYNWIDYRANKLGNTLTSHATNNGPIKKVLAKIDGSDATVPKLKKGWEYWGKLNWESIKVRFDPGSTTSKSQRPKARNAFKRQEFGLLSPESQAYYTEEARKIHAEAKEESKKRKEGPVLLPPTEAQQ